MRSEESGTHDQLFWRPATPAGPHSQFRRLTLGVSELLDRPEVGLLSGQPDPLSQLAALVGHAVRLGSLSVTLAMALIWGLEIVDGGSPLSWMIPALGWASVASLPVSMLILAGAQLIWMAHKKGGAAVFTAIRRRAVIGFGIWTLFCLLSGTLCATAYLIALQNCCQ